MSFGFTCNAQNGDLLVSSDYLGYHALATPEFVSSHTGAATGPYTKYRVYYPRSDAPLVFFAMAVNDTGAFWGLEKSGDYWLFNVSGTVRASVSKIKCFGIFVGSGSTNNGLVVKNNSGAVTFASNASPLWITDYAELSSVRLNTPAFADFSYTLAYSNANPIVLCPLVFMIYNPASGGSLTLIGWKRTGANTYTTTDVYNDSGRAFVDVAYQMLVAADLV
jgi:hypothetical protein